MIKVKTFTTPLKIFHVMEEIHTLDEQVNQFIADNNIKKVISVNDATTQNEGGLTMGLVRVLAYEE